MQPSNANGISGKVLVASRNRTASAQIHISVNQVLAVGPSS
jgi:hypothetical protein